MAAGPPDSFHLATGSFPCPLSSSTTGPPWQNNNDGSSPQFWPGHPKRTRWISGRGPRYLKTTGRHVPSPGERRNAVRSRGILQVLRRVWRTCHDVLLPPPPQPEPTSKRGFSYVFPICTFKNHVYYSDFKVMLLTFFLELRA